MGRGPRDGALMSIEVATHECFGSLSTVHDMLLHVPKGKRWRMPPPWPAMPRWRNRGALGTLVS